jgi:hypothetical protein
VAQSECEVAPGATVRCPVHQIYVASFPLDEHALERNMISPRKQRVVLFVERSFEQWVVQDPDGNFWLLPSKEPLLWVRTFRNLEERRQALLDWVRTYNDSWILERHGYLTPPQARQVLDKARLAA